MSKLFISYASGDSAFVCAVHGQLRGSFGDVYRFEERQLAGPFPRHLADALQRSTHFLLFVGEGSAESEWQRRETHDAVERGLPTVVVVLPDVADRLDGVLRRFDQRVFDQQRLPPLCGEGFEDALAVARDCCQRFQVNWTMRTGLPYESNILNYEKDIIAVYQRLSAPGAELADPTLTDLRRLVELGLPPQWPRVAEIAGAPDDQLINALIPRIGKARPRSAMVAVTALRSQTEQDAAPLYLPEAGPRSHLRRGPTPARKFRVAVVVVGGIAPGINAVIDGIVSRQWLYAEAGGYAGQLRVHGLLNGPQALFEEDAVVHLVTRRSQVDVMKWIDTPGHAHEGGSIIGTSRDDTLLGGWRPGGGLDMLVAKLARYHVVYVIGGDGGMRLAHAIATMSQEPTHVTRRQLEHTGELSVVGIPKSMDNDILWVWQTFGFMSAVEKSREVVEHMHTEISSNPRLGIVQLFGSVSGFVVSHAILAGSAPKCDVALIPEVPFTLAMVADHLRHRLASRGGVPHGLVVMAETALPTDVDDVIGLIAARQPGGPPLLTEAEEAAMRAFIEQKRAGKTMAGHTADELRSACLKVVARGLEVLLRPPAAAGHPGGGGSHDRWQRLRVVTNEPRHIIRAIPPSSQDIIIARRLGTLAVDNAMAGYTDFMISQWLTEFVLVPLPLVVLGRKQIHKDGIFWKSVLSKTDSFDVYAEEAP